MFSKGYPRTRFLNSRWTQTWRLSKRFCLVVQLRKRYCKRNTRTLINKNYLSPALVKKVEQFFENFGNKEFLTAVEKCYKTNVNESFHHVVWSLCPKEQYNCLREYLIALKLTKDTSNDGVWKTYFSFYKMLNLLSQKTWALLKIDKDSIVRSDYWSKLTICKKRH